MFICLNSLCLLDVRRNSMLHKKGSCGPHCSALPNLNTNFSKWQAAVYLQTCDVRHGRNGTYLHRYTAQLFKDFSSMKCLENLHFGVIVMSKKSEIVIGSPLAFKRKSAVHVN